MGDISHRETNKFFQWLVKGIHSTCLVPCSFILLKSFLSKDCSALREDSSQPWIHCVAVQTHPRWTTPWASAPMSQPLSLNPRIFLLEGSSSCFWVQKPPRPSPSSALAPFCLPLPSPPPLSIISTQFRLFYLTPYPYPGVSPLLVLYSQPLPPQGLYRWWIIPGQSLTLLAPARVSILQEILFSSFLKACHL